MITAIGDTVGNLGQSVGQMKFTTNGNTLAMVNRTAHKIHILDFDKSTGVLSNLRNINTSQSVFLYGLEFDLEGRYLYNSSYTGVIGDSKIYQYDLFASNISASGILIGSTNDTHIGSLQIAPDQKINLARNNSAYIGVINQPYLGGATCNFVANGFYLKGKTSRFGLPSQIQIDLSSGIEENQSNRLKIYPNPVTDILTMEFANNVGDTEIQLFDISGKQLFPKIKWVGRKINIDLSNYESGVYIIRSNAFVKRFIKY